MREQDRAQLLLDVAELEKRVTTLKSILATPPVMPELLVGIAALAARDARIIQQESERLAGLS